LALYRRLVELDSLWRAATADRNRSLDQYLSSLDPKNQSDSGVRGHSRFAAQAAFQVWQDSWHPHLHRWEVKLRLALTNAIARSASNRNYYNRTSLVATAGAGNPSNNTGLDRGGEAVDAFLRWLRFATDRRLQKVQRRPSAGALVKTISADAAARCLQGEIERIKTEIFPAVLPLHTDQQRQRRRHQFATASSMSPFA
jgi:hypothetical protein